VERRVRLRHMLYKADAQALRYSEEFSDPVKLLAVAEDAQVKDIVSKLSYQRYRSGKNPG
jgi:hypothetical protein